MSRLLQTKHADDDHENDDNWDDYDDHDDHDEMYDFYYVFTALEYKHLAWAAVGRDEELVEDIQ